MRLVFSREACRDFVADHTTVGSDWYEGIGLERDGKLIAAAVYTDLTERNVQIHVSGVGRWAVPMFLTAAFRYPFVQLGLPRVTGLVDASNEKALKLNEHLGFVREGLLREASEKGDVVVMGMLRRECRWVYGQEEVSRSRAA